MRKSILRYATVAAFVFGLSLSPAEAQNPKQAEAAAPSVTYFLSDPQDKSHHKITISIPADYFMDGMISIPGSTEEDLLLRVSWPSWQGDPRGFDRDSLRILGAAANSADSNEILARSLLVSVATARPWKEPLDRPVPVELATPLHNPLPTPSGHGIKQVMHNKANFLDDKDVYVLMADLPEMTLACDKDGVVPQCQQCFVFDHIVLQVSYPRRDIGSWFEIMNDVKKKFSSFVKQP